MGFTLDKLNGVGSGTVKVTASENKTTEVIKGQVLVQVKGATKKVIQLIQKASEVTAIPFIFSDVYILPSDGGEFTVHYGAKSVDTLITEDDNDSKLLFTIGYESGEDFEYTLVASGTDEQGSWKRYSVSANDSDKVKQIECTCTYGTSDSSAIIRQSFPNSVVLPDFDFFVFSFEWTEESGKDLDSATFVEGTNIPIKSSESYPDDPDKKLDDIFVGYGGSQNSTIYGDNIKTYLEYAGDNVTSGLEGSLINLKNICKSLSPGTKVVKAYIYANYYGGRYDTERGTGDMTLKVKTYKGENGLTLDTGLHTFIPNDGTELMSEEIINMNCLAYSSSNSTGHLDFIKSLYTHLCTIEYDVKSRSAIVIPQTEVTGRSLEATGKFRINNREYESIFFGNSGIYYYTEPINIPKEGGTFTIQFADLLENSNRGGEIAQLVPSELTLDSLTTLIDELPVTIDESNMLVTFDFEAFDPSTEPDKYSVECVFKPSNRPASQEWAFRLNIVRDIPEVES